MDETTDKARRIKETALRLGFDACGIAEASALTHDGDRLAQWLADGANGTMRYMENHASKRTDIRLLVEGARSVIVVLMNYYTDKKQPADVPQIAKYAYGTDYHFVVKERLNRLLREIDKHIVPCQGRVFCDSAPLFERRWAERAGLGWIGKNTQLINPKIGSYCFIGEIVVDATLPYDSPMPNRCGKCRVCLEACPTGALAEPHRMDARRCVSYQTIEHKSNSNQSIARQCGNRLFGCDTCLEVCPWNRNIKQNSTPELQPNEQVLSMTERDWISFTRSDFNRLFKNSPLQRAGYRKLRNRLDELGLNGKSFF